MGVPMAARESPGAKIKVSIRGDAAAIVAHASRRRVLDLRLDADPPTFEVVRELELREELAVISTSPAVWTFGSMITSSAWPACSTTAMVLVVVRGIGSVDADGDGLGPE